MKVWRRRRAGRGPRPNHTGSRSSSRLEYSAKGVFDCTAAALALIVLAPLMAVVAIVIRLRSPGPVVLRQERVGLNGRRFRLYKFRTLPASNLAVSESQWVPPASDGWGEYLRRTGIDELPQLLNVLQGDMSLVGPRPERPHFVNQFSQRFADYPLRHSVRGGITGWAQVHGWRGDTSIRARLDHDLYYVRHCSLASDVRILVKTLVLLAREQVRIWPALAGEPSLAVKNRNA